MRKNSNLQVLDKQFGHCIKNPDEWTIEQAIFVYLVIESAVNQIRIEKLLQLKKEIESKP